MADEFPIGTVSGQIELEDRFSTVLDSVKRQLSGFEESAGKFGGSIKGAFESPFDSAKESIKGFFEDLGPVGVGLVGMGTVVAGVGVGLFELADHAAEEFNEAGAQFTQQLSGMATAVGVALIPAMTLAIEVGSRFVLALEHIADL